MTCPWCEEEVSGIIVGIADYRDDPEEFLTEGPRFEREIKIVECEKCSFIGEGDGN